MHESKIEHYSSKSIFGQLVCLFRKLESRRRWQLSGVILFAILSSVLEALSIGALLPFLAMLSGGQIAVESVFFDKLYGVFPAFPALRGSHGITTATVLFVGALLMAAGVRLMTSWMQARLSQTIGTEIGANIFRGIMYQPYLLHVSRNSSEIVAALTAKVGAVVVGIVSPALLLIQSIIIGIAIIAALFIVDRMVAGLVMGFFGLLYGLVIGFTKAHLSVYSLRISQTSSEIIKVLQESLGGIRDVLIDGSQEIYCKRFAEVDSALRRMQANIMIVNTAPRYLVETLGIIVLCIMGAYLVVRDGVASNSLPMLGAFALGAQRLLPMLQQAYANWVVMRSNRQTFADVLILMNQPSEPIPETRPAPLPFFRTINLSNISFRYPGCEAFVLRHFNMRIAHGQRIGIVGVSGSGKSTLLDILMGLLLPTQGALKVDGVTVDECLQAAWRRNLAHVPQVIHLMDGTVLENIALGVPREEVDMVRVLRAVEGAQLAQTIASWPEGFQTTVGERGVRISGGQRQRIGIARALYKQASVVVFDEATSALDSETEAGVIDALNAIGRDITLIVVAHRLTTLKQCDQIYEIDRGAIARSGTYAELFEQKPI